MYRKIYGDVETALGRIAAGDDGGVDALCRSMGGTMLALARGILCDTQLAEDAVQESLLNVIRGIGKYEAGTNGYAWVCRIVRNTSINVLRSYGTRSICMADELSALSDGCDPIEEITAKVTVETLIRALPSLEARRMIYMKYFLDMTVREIAAELGRSKTYVADGILKAENVMRRAYEGKYPS